MSEKEIIFYSAVIGFVLGALIMFFVMKDDILKPEESKLTIMWDINDKYIPEPGDTLVIKHTDGNKIFLGPKK